MNITLTPEIENALTAAALKQGTTPERLALDYLREQFIHPDTGGIPDEGQGTLADFLAGYIGVFSSGEYVPGGAQMATDTGKKFTEWMIQKRDQGRI